MMKLLPLLLALAGLPAHARNTPTDTVQYSRQSGAPSSPVAGTVMGYVLDSDGKFYIKNSSGTAKACTYSGDLVNADFTGSAGITNANLASMANKTFKCRTSSGTGAPEDCTAAQAQAILGEEPMVLQHESTPSNPSAGYVKVYAKSDNKVYKLDSSGNETEMGSGGGGSGGVNFIALDSNFVATAQNNVDLEVSIGGWTAFADAAATEPTDLTGGSPTVTCTRGTSSPLNGVGNLVVTKDAANRQGEGCAVAFYVPPGYRGKTGVISFPLSISSGSVASGDLQVWVYDVTNSVKVKPFNLEVMGSQVQARFDIPSTMAQGRLGIYFASTAAGAVTAKIDDVFAGFKDATFGFAGTEWQPYTPTFGAGWGTPTNIDVQWRRMGDSVQIRGSFTTGTVAASLASISLPTGLTVDAAKVALANTSGNPGPYVGQFGSSSGHAMAVLATGTSTSLFYAAGASTLTPQNGNASFANSQVIGINVQVPISGWSSNVTMAESSSFLLSHYLANGSRVTTTPTALGQYRSLIKDNAATTVSDTDGSGEISTANGIRLYAVSGTGAGTSTDPNRWIFYIGKNKTVRVIHYASTGRTGSINTAQVWDNDGTNVFEWGTAEVYDPTTGILMVGLPFTGSTGTRYTGKSYSGETSGIANATSHYFDVLVSENALSVGYQSPRSQVILEGGNGAGSTNTLIQRFDTTTTTGADITCTDSATAGNSCAISTTGVYTLFCTQFDGGGGDTWGASVDGTVGTGIGNLSWSSGGKCFNSRIDSAAGGSDNGSCTRIINAGQTVRFHHGTVPDATNAADTVCGIVKVSH